MQASRYIPKQLIQVPPHLSKYFCHCFRFANTSQPLIAIYILSYFYLFPNFFQNFSSRPFLDSGIYHYLFHRNQKIFEKHQLTCKIRAYVLLYVHSIKSNDLKHVTNFDPFVYDSFPCESKTARDEIGNLSFTF